MPQGHRHNGGRQPRRKNIERTTLADIASVEPDVWDAEASGFLADRRLEDWKTRRPIGRRGDLFKVSPNPELEEVVKRYVANRDAVPAIDKNSQDAIVARLNEEVRNAPERIAIETPAFALEKMQIAPAAHDILLQMFAEKKISQGRFHAGRRWQWDREAATVQPTVSIDWSRSSPSPYQGEDMSERQWDAIKRRRQFTTRFGIAAATMLDFLLEADRGRSELMQLTRLPVIQIECAVEELLDKVCECFG